MASARPVRCRDSKECRDGHLSDIKDMQDGWNRFFEQYGVYFSAPLDLDFHDAAEFSGGISGDRRSRAADPEGRRPEARRRSRGHHGRLKEGSDGRLILTTRRKPSSGTATCSSAAASRRRTSSPWRRSTDKDLVDKCPTVLHRLVAKMKELLGIEGGGGCRERSGLSEWTPVDVPELEPAAEAAVRTTSNTVVVAGPGRAKPSCSPSGPATCSRRTCAAHRGESWPSASSATPPET